MIALMVLAALLIYLAIAWLVVKRLETRKAKWLVAVAFVLVPTWDMALGRVYFQHLCSTEAGERIYKTAKNVAGVYQEEIVLDNGTLLRKKPAYQYVELLRSDVPDINRRLARTTVDSTGTFQTVMMPLEQRKSRYSLGRLPTARLHSMLFQISILEYRITDLQTNEMMAKHIAFVYGGGWVSRFLDRFGGTGHPVYVHCPQSFSGGPEFIFKVLEPGT